MHGVNGRPLGYGGTVVGMRGQKCKLPNAKLNIQDNILVIHP
jgi:hypothetical protein